MMEEGKVLRLFGATINWSTDHRGGGGGAPSEETEDVIRKCSSMGNLVKYGVAAPILAGETAGQGAGDHGYLSDGEFGRHCRRRRRGIGLERKKGVAWTEEEHKAFLAGLHKLGRGDWRGIAKNFVTTRTPTQVASHAQKYFLRQSNPTKKRRRSSLFDVAIDANVDPPASSANEFVQRDVQLIGGNSHHTKADVSSDLPALSLALSAMEPDCGDLELRIAPPQCASGAISVV